MDLNIEGTGEVMGWSPPIGEILSPGFEAVMKAHQATYSNATSVSQTKRFIENLEKLGYCVAKYES